MAYEPNVWKCGDTITADQLNRLEQAVAELSQGGGQSGALVVRQQEEQSIVGVTLYDKTWEEVFDASSNGQLVTINLTDNEEYVNIAYLINAQIRNDEYLALFVVGVGETTDEETSYSTEVLILTAPSADDYLRVPSVAPSPIE